MTRKLLLPLFTILLFGCSRKISQKYICPPCDQSCDTEVFHKGGACYMCKMELVEKGSYNEALTKEQISEDFNVLLTTLTKNHPGLYDYQSKGEFEKKTETLRQEIESAKTGLDEYRIVSKLIAAVSDAHTYVMNPYYQNILQEEKLFPILPTINNNQIRINGKRVESINGNSEKEILKKLQSFANSDGNTLPYKNAFIEMEFPLKYFVFMDKSSSFDVVFENGETKKLQGKSYFKEGLKRTTEHSFNMEGETATIKIPTWEDKTASSFNKDLNEMADSSVLGKFISESLEKAIDEKAEYLVIDLRGNKGGSSGPAAILLSHLIDKPFKYYSEIKVASNNFPTKEYVINKGLISFYESADSQNLIDERDGAYFFKQEFLPKIQPNKNQFLGTVEVLVDKYSLSVSTDVVAVLKKNREVKITGDEMGGSLKHYCAGNYIYLKLPHSGIEISVPLQRLQY